MATPKKYKNRAERLAARRRYHHQNKDEINRKRREWWAKYKKKPKSNYKNCTSCGKRLEKNLKNFRYISKKRKE